MVAVVILDFALQEKKVIEKYDYTRNVNEDNVKILNLAPPPQSAQVDNTKESLYYYTPSMDILLQQQLAAAAQENIDNTYSPLYFADLPDNTEDIPLDMPIQPLSLFIQQQQQQQPELPPELPTIAEIISD